MTLLTHDGKSAHRGDGVARDLDRTGAGPGATIRLAAPIENGDIASKCADRVDVRKLHCSSLVVRFGFGSVVVAHRWSARIAANDER